MYAMREFHCPICDKDFAGRFPKTRKYCSRECSIQGRGLTRRTGSEIACGQCGAGVYRAPSEQQNKAMQFCSKECANSFQGRNKTTHTCETCEKEFKWSPSRRKSYNIRYCSIPCRDADPARRVQLLKMNNSLQSRKTTTCEQLGYGMLDDMGVDYVRQFMIDGRFCVDAYLPSKNIVLQFDGDYWHGNPTKYAELDHRQRRRVQFDHSQDAFMASRGIVVFRAWHSDMKDSMELVKARLQALLSAP